MNVKNLVILGLTIVRFSILLKGFGSPTRSGPKRMERKVCIESRNLENSVLRCFIGKPVDLCVASRFFSLRFFLGELFDQKYCQRIFSRPQQWRFSKARDFRTKFSNVGTIP